MSGTTNLLNIKQLLYLSRYTCFYLCYLEVMKYYISVYHLITCNFTKTKKRYNSHYQTIIPLTGYILD